MDAGPARTVSAVLARFDSTFSSFSAAFNEGQYVLWIGSGISRERVPNVSDLLANVIEHLRSRTDGTGAGAEYTTALNDVLQLASLQQEESEQIDTSVRFEDWPLRSRILAALIGKYSQVLDVPVGDRRPEDYLVWEALDVPSTYGSPDLEPDVEHLCVAILMLEGLVPSVVTANWDGLLEKALARFTPTYTSQVRVAVRPEDFRTAGPPTEIIKFHGCAVRARQDEAEYRSRLVARESQISRWTEQPENRLMRKHLELLYTDRPTLVMGLSAQDANLHTVFASAIQDLERPWPSTPPSVVLTEENLAAHHRTLLRITYGNNHPGNAAAIARSALLGSYGKPTLLALVVSSLTEKLGLWLVREADRAWGEHSSSLLLEGLTYLRDFIATYADPAEAVAREVALEHQRLFIVRVVDTMNQVLTVFRTGAVPPPRTGFYQPLSVRSASQSLLNPDFPAQQFGRFAVAMALIGRGLDSGDWTLRPGASDKPEGGVVQLIAPTRSARVFLVKDAATSNVLALHGIIAEGDSDGLIVVADAEPLPQTRSPRPRFGRVGRPSAGRFNIASAMAESETVEELHEAFRLAGGF